MNRYSAVLFMVILAAISMAAHFLFGWRAEIEDATMHGQSVAMGDYIGIWARETFENWQSEWLQLAMQFAILAGAFAPAVRAHEQDQHEIKETLARIEADLIGLKGEQ